MSQTAPVRRRKPARDTSSKTDPVFAAINRHRRAWDHRNKLGPEHATWSAAFDAARDRMRELIETRPSTIEGAAAQAAYARAIEFFEEGSLVDDSDPKTWSLNSFGRNLTGLVSRPYSAEFQSVLSTVGEIEVTRKKRDARCRKIQKRYHHSKKAKQFRAKMRKMRNGPTVGEVATETKTLQRVAAMITAMIPPDGEQMIQMAEEDAKRRAKH